MALLYGSLAYMLGIVLGWWLYAAAGLECPLPWWLWLLPVSLLPATPLLKDPPREPAPSLRWPVTAGFEPPGRGPSQALLAGLLLCLLAGALRYLGQPFEPCWTPRDLAFYNLPSHRAFDHTAPRVTLTGYLRSYPLVKDVKQELIVQVQALEDADGARSVAGAVRLMTGIHRRYAYGQPVRVTGRLVTPPALDSFSYRAYLARKGIHSLLYGASIEPLPGPLQGNPLLHALYAIRARGEAFLNRALPEPYAALANGMLLGIEAGIADDLYDQFNLTGSSHVIVISGSNVALIAGVMLALTARILGRTRALWPTLAGIACYALLVGGDAAVVRAAVMGSMAVTAAALNRRSTGMVSLAAACAFMTLLNPLAVWDVGLQLSSAATAGLILLVPWLSRLLLRGAAAVGLPGHWLSRTRTLLQDGLVVTLAANLMTLPLTFYHFGRLSVVSLLTNLLIVPVQPLIMLGGSAGVLAGVLGLEWLGRLLLLVPWVGLVWTVAVVQWTAALPGAGLELGGYGVPALLASYGSLLVVRWRATVRRAVRQLLSWRWLAAQRRLVTPAVAAGLAVASVLSWSAGLALPDGRLHLWFLDIGQGDGIFVQTPSGRQVLIDGGASPQLLFTELGAVMPFWDRTIDLLVLTHPDGDHMDGQIEAPARYEIATAIYTPHAAQHPDAETWREHMAAGHVALEEEHAGAWIDLGDGVALWVLWPPAEGYRGDDADNENSFVLKVVYGEFSALLTGDAGLASERALLRGNTPLASALLKVGHHGSRSSSSPEFIAQVAPQIAVIQAGKENVYGHPHAEVLGRLAGRTVLRNDEHGRIHVETDGRMMWVETEAQQP
ncbi:MAG: DNA internalization-related competence protein ComEC/Rec2 [Caldilineaceae bacterium]|nr:DNA internalization-related competence protein ComEC/Rec2 [Caldilineaceae bacterium]